MSDFYERISKLSPKRLALLAMDLQARLEESQRGKREPIAIISMGCRFPGAAGPEAYWQLLRDGVDAISEIPPSRWDRDAWFDPNPDAAGKIATLWGGFVEPIDQFEPQIFGISPREAQTMDPQQRLLLEVSWETLERGGYGPAQLSGSSTGVFVGICNNDYSMMLLGGEPESIDAYLSTGNAHSIASGRISYVLGLQGPSISVDTACSSSLVALHLAVQSLRNGECRMALAGGANAILAPTTTMTLSRARMMAADGRCKAFDARADGFVRGEGCGMVLLKRLSDAVADGDPILAVIRGTAANQDGRSNGITAPNGPSQVAVLRAALADAGLQPADVHYVETHGTGTSLGDPIEVQALGAALGEGRDAATRLQIGSVKTNFGHLESAAGVAGLMKVVLMLQHGIIPPHLHMTALNPHIAWDELPIDVPTAGVPWPNRPGARIAGVSSFGFSGTNVHVLVEQAPDAAASTPSARATHLLTLSARTPGALKAQAQRFAAHLAAHPDLEPADVAFTANSGRAALPWRLALTADSLVEMGEALAAHAAGHEVDGLVLSPAAVQGAPAVAFVFTGHGAQYAGMGLKLYASEPVFRAALDRCAELMAAHVDMPLLTILSKGAGSSNSNGASGAGETSPLDNMAYAQPALFALQVALAELWQSWGVMPAAAAGHSIGEYAAAVVAGVMSLEDGVRLVAARGRLLASLPPNGEMASVLAEEARVLDLLAPYSGQVSIAAINGPASLAISGLASAVEAALADLTAAGIETRRLAIPVAAHSPHVNPILDAFSRELQSVHFAPAQIELISTLTGRAAGAGDLASADYWRRQLREPVRFADAALELYARGCRAFVEIGPHPTLIGAMRHFVPAAAAAGGAVAWAPSLHRRQEDARAILGGLGALAVAGVPINWQGVFAHEERRRVALPSYPFERQRYWVDAEPARPVRGTGAAQSARKTGAHPLLGARLSSPALQGAVFESHLSLADLPWLADHRVYGAYVAPSPVMLEMVHAAAAAAHPGRAFSVADFAIREALVLPAAGDRIAQLVLGALRDGAAAFELHSRGEEDESWTLHATGRLAEAAPAAPAQPLDPAAVQAACGEQVDGDAYYAQLAQAGLDFGPAFRGLRTLWRRDGETLGQVDLPPALHADAARYALHPALLDACLHLLGAPLPGALSSATRDGSAYLLVAIDHFRLLGKPTARLWNHTTLREGRAGGAAFTADVRLYDDEGRLIAEAGGVHLRATSRATLLRATRRLEQDWFYTVEWERLATIDGLGHADGEDAALPPPAQLATAMAPHYPALAARHGLAAGLALVEELEALSVSYALQALRDLGWAPLPGALVQAEPLAARLGVAPQHQRLFGRLLAMLAEAGLLHSAGDGWQVAHALPQVDPAAEARALAARLPAPSPELALLTRCGSNLAGALRGEVDPVALLFPNGSTELTEPLYGDTPFARVANELVAQTVQAALAQRPAGRPLRILEIGAGSGATTRAVLPMLPAENAEYWFTDISPHFTARAAETLQAPALQARVFDVERDPIAQGLPAHGFDLVLAANVLHATADLQRTLDNVATLLAPGGLLLLLEGTRALRWVDLSFGLTAGWWRFSDQALRPAHPLLNATQWLALLESSGFAQPAALPGAEDGQAVLLARAPAAPAAQAAQAAQDGADWLILADEQGVGAALAAELARSGETATLVYAAHAAAAPGDGRRRVAGERDALRALLGAGEAQAVNPATARRVVYLWGLDGPPGAAPTAEAPTAEALLAAQMHATGGALALAQALAQALEGTRAELWLVTRGAQPAGALSSPSGVGQAALWGLGRVVALELPEIWGGLVDLDPAGAADDAQRLLAVLRRSADEDQIALRAGAALAPRLTRATVPPAPPLSFDAEGSYLITGGLGALGLKLARRLVEGGARTLVLTGRHVLPARSEWPSLAPDSRQALQAAALRELEAMGAAITVIAADVSDRATMSALCARFGNDLPPLRGLFHTAAELGSAPVADLSPQALQAMLRPKLLGGWLLHELTRSQPLQHFVLFSSTTALWGSRALAHYAAANQTLDALAHYRHNLGLPALSVNWGTWDEMRVASAEEQRVVAGFGLGRMPAEQALDALAALLAASTMHAGGAAQEGDAAQTGGVAQMAVAAVDWQLLKPAYEARRVRPLLARMDARPPAATPASASGAPDSAAAADGAAAESTPELLRRIAGLAGSERREVIAGYVRETVARALGIKQVWQVDDRQGLFEMGMDSLMSVELKGRFERGVGRPLPSTLTFNYPSVVELTGFFADELLPEVSAAAAAEADADGAPATEPFGAQPAPVPAGNVDELSEDDLAALLEAKLARLQRGQL